jgi:hypothetical protein
LPEGHFTKDGKITELKIHGGQFSLKGIETKDEYVQALKSLLQLVLQEDAIQMQMLRSGLKQVKSLLQGGPAE